MKFTKMSIVHQHGKWVYYNMSIMCKILCKVGYDNKFIYAPLYIYNKIMGPIKLVGKQIVLYLERWCTCLRLTIFDIKCHINIGWLLAIM